jgi:hypothetical protein
MERAMSRQIDVDQEKNHIGGNFEWEKEPKCSCGKLKDAVDEKFLFVSNFVDGEGENESNQFYILPVNSEGFFARADGIPISNCPWCGDKIIGRKKYPTKKAKKK